MIGESASGATVYLEYSPRNARLELNNTPLPKSKLKAKGEGYLLKLKPGKHTFASSARGYLAQSESFVLSEGSILTVYLHLNKQLKKDRSCDAKDPACRGEISVVTKPAGARLWIDGAVTEYITQPSRRDPTLGTRQGRQGRQGSR